jgi:outer membrane protein OmpA-like peptidoglycan-associated protein
VTIYAFETIPLSGEIYRETAFEAPWGEPEFDEQELFGNEESEYGHLRPGGAQRYSRPATRPVAARPRRPNPAGFTPRAHSPAPIGAFRRPRLFGGAGLRPRPKPTSRPAPATPSRSPVPSGLRPPPPPPRHPVRRGPSLPTIPLWPTDGIEVADATGFAAPSGGIRGAVPPVPVSEHARWVQSCLARVTGTEVPITGVMDAATRDAVRTFQQSQALAADGIVGPPTQAALASACTQAGAAPDGGSGGQAATPAKEPPDGAAAEPSGVPAEEPAASTSDGDAGQDAGPQSEFGFRKRACGCPSCRARAAQDYVRRAGIGRSGPDTFASAFEFGEVEEAKGALRFETAAKPTRTGAQCTTTFVDCPPPGKPAIVLDHFKFDSSALDPARHRPVVIDLARRIVASQRAASPIRSVLIAGHTDPTGDDNYNFGLARRRAESVGRALCTAIERTRPGATGGLSLRLTSCGERQPKAAAPQSRRVEIFLPGAPRPPRRESSCGVPLRAVRAPGELESEIQTIRRRTRGQTVRPRLSFFQNASASPARNHFQCQADRWAARISAQALPTTSNCPQRVAGTPYDSGADIIAAIEAARRCQRKRLETVHIFSHAGSDGVFGAAANRGIYRDTVDPADRQNGARVVTDVPAAALTDEVVVVLHGCNTASGDDNFARAYFRHLSATLRNPRVFGHPNSGCAGRNNSWREYSRRSPDGKVRLRSLAPHYDGDGCCG